MELKLACIALAGLCSSAAFADVSITGKISGAYAWSKSVNGTSLNGVKDAESEIDFAGREDLGNGLKAIWQMNNNVHIADSPLGTRASNDTFASGDTWLGLSGGFGAVKLGHGVNAYGDGYWNGFFYDLGDHGPDKGVGGVIGKGDAGGQKGAIKYETPAFGHVNAAFSYATAENAGPNNGNAWALGANWEEAMFGVHVGYTRQALVDGSQNDAGHVTDWVLAGKVMPFAGLILSAENDHSTLSNNALTSSVLPFAVPSSKGAQNSLSLRAEYKPQRLALRAGYIHTRNYEYDCNVKHDEYLLGVSYDLSKHSSMFAEYLHSKVDSDAYASEGMELGLRVTF
ncbi:porin [Crenobacter sp. SG2305]|uniref:porin n=1 Tax=Crenobacter oryzisoli TaxID=3056844 RepID=UPI0025AB5355|nr:porin [Crenobacter sp. SG2305]MDN0083238.1 porin [Crenobacter sp. SG2305]